MMHSNWAPTILSIDVLIQNWTTAISHVCVNIIEQEMRKGQIVVGRIELEKKYNRKLEITLDARTSSPSISLNKL